MIRIVTVIGARPQFIKASVMSGHFRQSGLIKEILLHTGQHFDHNMSDIFFSQLDIPNPQYNLGIHNAAHGKMTGHMLTGIEEVLLHEKPHYVIIYGDTNSTLAGALAAAKLRIPIMHIEAGLRSRNNTMPEEINRIVADRVSSLLCCPTDGAVRNLRQEGFDSFACTYSKTGDIMEDALRAYENRNAVEGRVSEKLAKDFEKYILCTLHRAENTDDPARMRQILAAWKEIADDISLVVPLHPRTRKVIGDLPWHKNLHFIEPVGYIDNLHLIKHSSAVMTDSGGMQKEAYMMKKFCITLRDETEWTELTDCSCNFLTGAVKETILEKYYATKKLKWNAPDDLYGGGKARFAIHDMITHDAATRGIL